MEFNIFGKPDDSELDIYLYDRYWNFSQSETYNEIESNTNEYREILKKNSKYSLTKIQNHSLNYSFRSLIYLYNFKRVSLKIKKFTIALESEQVETLENISDMSHLLIFLSQFELCPVSKTPIKSLEQGTYLLIDKIVFSEVDDLKIPGILPLYLICTSNSLLSPPNLHSR